MLACETSVTTAGACAKVKRAPCAARPSRFGVAARPPYDPSASARSVSMVTRRMLRSAFDASANDRWAKRPHEPTATAQTPQSRHKDHKELCGLRVLCNLRVGAWAVGRLTSAAAAST